MGAPPTPGGRKGDAWPVQRPLAVGRGDWPPVRSEGCEGIPNSNSGPAIWGGAVISVVSAHGSLWSKVPAPHHNCAGSWWWGQETGEPEATSPWAVRSSGEGHAKDQKTTTLVILTLRKPPKFKSRAPASRNVITLSPVSLPPISGVLRSLLGCVVSGTPSGVWNRPLVWPDHWTQGLLGALGTRATGGLFFSEFNQRLCCWGPLNSETSGWCERGRVLRS